MVRVRESLPRNASGAVDAQAWQALVCADHPELDAAALESAIDLVAELDRPELLEAGVDLAQLLLELRLDMDSLVVGLTYRAWREGAIDVADFPKVFTSDRLALVDSLDKLGAASRMSLHDDPMLLSNAEDQVQNVRLLLESLIDDVRVALIKLSERVVVLRLAKNASPTRKQRLGRESLALFAPLAGRLGLWRLKWAVEDLGFRYLEPETYMRVARQLDGRRDDRERRVAGLVTATQGLLGDEGLDAQVFGRAKHIYSIWRKMQQKDLDIAEVYDARALRVIVLERADCYRALGIIHSTWRHLPEEFDDYIANPKNNGYQSIHTAVVGPQEQILEVQIRTEDMHAEAEFGVCAHWNYKDSDPLNNRQMPGDRVAWLRQLLEWHDEGGGSEAVETLLSRGFDDVRIYVSTPQGHVLDLPRDATPVDFAYRVHTEIGHRARGAMVDGEPYPLSMPLRTGQRVEIITASRPEPEHDWLEDSLGFVRTSRARAKIQNWFRRQDVSYSEALGERMWRNAEKVLAMSLDADAIASALDIARRQDLFAKLGRGEVRLVDVLRLVPTPYRATGLTLPSAGEGRGSRAQVMLAEQSWPIGMALCCKPSEESAIAGYLDEADAILVHRKDCTLYQNAAKNHPLRVVRLSWQKHAGREGVRISVRGRNRHGLLRDIVQIMNHSGVSLVGTQAQLDGASAAAMAEVDVLLDCETLSLPRLLETLGRILLIPDVLRAERLE